MSDILNDDLTEIDNLFGYKPQPKQNPKNGDVSDLLERMRGGVFQQESSGNYQVKPNARTGATGGFQVMPENIPVWTKKYLGKSLTRDQFERDPQAQEAVFTGEMGKYLQKAREKAPDDDTALRMAAAAWYGGEGAMNRYDDPKRFRPDEPSFREYTTSVLKRSGKPAQPVDLSATDSLFSDSTDDLSDIDNLFGYNPQAETVPMEQKGLMSPADVGKQPVTPTFPSQMPSNLGGSTAQATPPMPERPETLEMQRMAAHDPVSTRAAVLYTPGSPLTPIAKGEVDVPLKDGSILRANIDKFNQFLQANGPTAYNDLKAGNLDFSSLIGGKAQPTNDTANKTAVITRDQNGTELVASSVETPDAIETEAAMQKAQFPNIPTTTEVVHSNDVVNGRVPLDNQAQRQQVMSKVALGKDPTEVLLEQQAPLQAKTPQFADLRNNSTQNQERQYTTGEPRILDDVTDQQQPSEPQRRVGAIENDDQAVADTVTVSKGTPQQQAREALAQLAPKYGFDPNEVLKANPDLNITRNGEAGKVDVTYGDIRRFTGNSADYDQARAEQRTEMPRLDLSLRRPQRLPDEREAEKALEDRIKETSYSIQQKALEHFSNPVNLTPFGAFNAPSIFNDPSDAWVQEEKKRVLKEASGSDDPKDWSYSKAWDKEKDYQEMSAAEFVPRMMFQTARSFTKNLISGTGKSLIVGSQLLEDSPLNPVNKLLPDDAKIGLRNVGNYADLVTRLVSSRDSATALKEMKWAKGTDDIDKQQAFQAMQEFDKAVGDDPVLKGRFFGGLADAGGSALAFIALGAAMPSLRLGKFAMGRMALNKGLGRTAAKLAMKAGELPLESAVSGGMQALGTGYEEGKNAGLSEADARNYGIMQGLIGTSEMIGAGGELVDAIKTPALRGQLALGILEAGKKIAKAGAKEAPEEFFQEVFQTSSGNAVLEYLKDNEPDTFQKVKNALNKLPKQVAKAAANEGIIALVTGGVMGGAGKAAQILSEQGQESVPIIEGGTLTGTLTPESTPKTPDVGKIPEKSNISPVDVVEKPDAIDISTETAKTKGNADISGNELSKEPKRLTVKDPVEPGTVVEVDGRGEAVVVQDNGKNVVIDHTPKPGKNGETTYTGRATVRKDKITVAEPLIQNTENPINTKSDEKTPTIQPQSAPMAEKPLVQDQAPDVPTSSEQVTKPAGKTDSPTATAAEEPQVIATESGRKTASQSEEVAPVSRPPLKVQSIQLKPREGNAQTDEKVFAQSLGEKAKDSAKTGTVPIEESPIIAKEGKFSGSLEIPRAEMPQISGDDFTEFKDFAKAKGVEIKPEQVQAKTLKPTQRSYNPEHSAQLPEAALDKPLTVSSDNRVLDGHNRLVRLLENGERTVTINRLPLTAEKALSLMKEFPKTTYKLLSQVGKRAENAASSEVEKPAQPKAKLSNTQLQFPKDEIKPFEDFRATIDPADVAPKEDLPTYAEDGLKIDPHVTVKYGIKTNDAADVSNLFDGEKPITLTLGKTAVFPGAEKGPGYDVVIAEVDSPDLHRLNAKITDNADVEPSAHPEYKPHVTLAYVKKGLGEKYAGRTDFEGKKYTFDGVTFSPADKSGKVNIPFRKGGEGLNRNNQDIINPIDTKAPQAEKVKQLRALIEENRPVVEGIAKKLADLGFSHTEIGPNNEKKAEAILGKANRPEIKAKKPWFDVEHIRDAYRFRAGFNSIEDLPKMAQVIKDAGVEFIKTDTEKFLKPGPWGWRPVALDLKMPNGQLVEFYASFPKMIDAQYSTDENHPVNNHDLFEKWRNATPEEIDAKFAEFVDDQEASKKRYQEAFDQTVADLGLTDPAALTASFTKAVRSLSSVTSAKSSSNSEAVATPRAQEEPSGERLIGTASTPKSLEPGITTAESSDRPTATNIKTPSKPSIPPTEPVKQEASLSASDKKRIAAIDKELLGLSGAMTNLLDAGFGVGEVMAEMKALREEKDKILGKGEPVDIPTAPPAKPTTIKEIADASPNISIVKPANQKAQSDKKPAAPVLSENEIQDAALDIISELYDETPVKHNDKNNKISDALSGLSDIFGDDITLKSAISTRPEFDEDKYAKSKALLDTIVTEIGNLSGDVHNDLMAIITTLKQDHKLSREGVVKLVPYIARFLSDQQKALQSAADESIKEVEDGSKRPNQTSETPETTGEISDSPRSESPELLENADSGLSQEPGASSTEPGTDQTGSVLSDVQRPDRPGDEPAGSETDGGKSDDLPASKPGKRKSGKSKTGDAGRVVGTTGNYYVNDIESFAAGGLKTKFRNNVAAIETLRKIQAEGRATATPEEQATLAKYIGWGQFPALFNTYNDKGEMWAKEREQLLSLISKEEFESASASTKNAHYTAPQVVRTVWDIVERLGFKGGNVLETSLGIGNFLYLMPNTLRGTSRVTGIELDTLTAQIAKLLFPSYDIRQMGYQEFRPPKGFYDLAISNVPFGSYQVNDSKMPHFLKNRIHNYFFAKAVEDVRPGGLVAFITSTGTMSSEDVLKHLAGKADLVTAIRFPADTFLKEAGTSVVTDLVILRVKNPRAAQLALDDVNMYEKIVEDDTLRIKDINAQIKELPKEDDGRGKLQLQLANLELHRQEVADKLAAARKRLEEAERFAKSNWTDMTTVADPGGGEAIPINKYYVENPKNLLGELNRSGTMYRGDSVNLSRTPDFEDKLAAAIAKMPKDVVLERESELAEQPKLEAAPDSMRQGSLAVKDGKIVSREGSFLVERPMPQKQIKNVIQVLKVRDALNATAEAERTGRKADAEELRKELNAEYDAYVKEFGTLHENRKAFEVDPDHYRLLALENYDKKTRKVTGKADVFTKPTVSALERATKATTYSDALNIVLNQSGFVDVKEIGSLMGVNPDEAGAELLKQGLAYNDPRDGWTVKDLYLSGEVRRKLREAREAAILDPEFEPNVAALEAVQPEDLPYRKIEPTIGAAWIPAEDIKQFMADAMTEAGQDADPSDFEVVKLATGDWIVNIKREALRKSAVSTNVLGTEDRNFSDIIAASIRDTPITIRRSSGTGANKTSYVDRKASSNANRKVKDIRTKFKRWVWADDARRERLHRAFNDTYNDTIETKWNGDHMTFPGMNPLWVPRLYSHIKHAVYRLVTQGRLLAAHEVGTGKTNVMIASAMELRRLKLAKKPAIVCLNANVEQVAETARELYPGARVLAAFQGMDAETRKQTSTRIMSGDWDIVVLTHENLGKIPMSKARQMAFINEELQYLRDQVRAAEEASEEESSSSYYSRRKSKKSDNRVVKALEAKIANREAKLKELFDKPKDDAITFEETGIDFLMVDEAHAFKNLDIYTTREGTKGIPSSDAQRAMNMFLLTRYLTETHNNRGVAFFTGTPISNTTAEAFNMMRYLMYNDLKARGIHHFDSWAANYGENMTVQEMTATGEYKAVSAFRRFKNLETLSSLMQTVMDVVWADDVGDIVRPKRVDKIIATPMSDAQKAYQLQLVARAEALKTMTQAERKEKGADNWLSLGTDAKKMAIDMRLVDPYATDDPNSKTNVMVNKILELHKQRPDQVQLIFSDVGVNGTKVNPKFSLYKDIIDKLVDGGIPRNKIIDFSKFTSGKKANEEEDTGDSPGKEEAMRRLNAGEALIAIGSSQKLGTGVNVQKNVMAMHKLDVKQRPDQDEQETGRGHRGGNSNSEVELYRYTTQDSFDMHFYDRLQQKKGFIDQLLRGDVAGEFIDSIDDSLDYNTVVAVTASNPLIKERIDVIKELRELEDDYEGFQENNLRLRDRLARTKRSIQSLERDLQDLIEDREAAVKQKDNKTVTIDGYGDFEIEPIAEVRAREAEADEIRKDVIFGWGEIKTDQDEKDVREETARRLDALKPLNFEKAAKAITNRMRQIKSSFNNYNERSRVLYRNDGRVDLGTMFGFPLVARFQPVKDSQEVTSKVMLELPSGPAEIRLTSPIRAALDILHFTRNQKNERYQKDIDRLNAEIPRLEAGGKETFDQLPKLEELRKKLTRIEIELGGENIVPEGYQSVEARMKDLADPDQMKDLIEKEEPELMIGSIGEAGKFVTNGNFVIFGDKLPEATEPVRERSLDGVLRNFKVGRDLLAKEKNNPAAFIHPVVVETDTDKMIFDDKRQVPVARVAQLLQAYPDAEFLPLFPNSATRTVYVINDGELVGAFSMDAQPAVVGEDLIPAIRKAKFMAEGKRDRKMKPFKPLAEAIENSKAETAASAMTAAVANRTTRQVEEPTLKSGVSTDQTETESFKKWFKDGGFRDENSRPAVLYHGTDATFDDFKLGEDGKIYLTDSTQKASLYAGVSPNDKPGIDRLISGGNVIPVFARNVKQVDRGIYVVTSTSDIKSAIGNNGNFDENDPNILKSGLSRKLDTADVLESERMTVEEMKDLAYAPFDDLIDGRAKVDVINGNISANAASHEIYRRALEYVRVKAGRTRIGAKQFEDLFTGVFMRPNEVRDIITGLEEKRDEAKQLGYTPAEVQVFDDHINALKESAEAGQGTAVIYILDRALPHELFHRADYMGAMDKALMQRHSKGAAKALDEHRVTSILAAKHFAKFNQFSQLSDSMRRAWIRSEIPPHLLELSEDQLREQYGITPEMAADYMLKWFEGYVEKNGIESLDNFDKEEINVQTFLKQVKDEFSQPAAVADGTVGETDESSPPVERKPEREKRGNDRSDGESPSVSLNPGEKLRRLPKTMRAAGLDAIDMAYEVYGDKTATDDAARLLNDYGIEGSIKLLRDLPAASQDAQHAILSFMLIRTLQDHANEIRATDPATALKHYELSLTLAREHAVKATGAGRFTRIPSVIGPTIEHLTYAVQGVIEDKYGEGRTLNDSEREKWEALGRELEAAHAKMTGLQKENRNQKAKIKRLEEAKEGKKPKRRSSSSQKSRAKLVQLVKDEKQSTVDALRAKLRARFNAEPAQMSAVPNAQFEQRPVMIEELLKRDADLREYIQKENPDAGREVTEPVTIGIKSGGGVVIDGFKRIAQALSNGQMTVLAYVQANEPSLYSAVAPDEDFPIDDFAEVGAMMLTDGLAGPDDYLPHDFEADMVAEFGDVVKPYFTEIYKKAWAKRNEWLDEIRYQQTKERIEAKYNDGNELEDWEIEEILGEQKAKAKRRRAIEAYHRMAAGGKPVNRNLADLKRIISELAPDTETAIGAALQAERLGADEMYARMKEMGITDGKAQREAIRNGKEILDQARIELQAEKDAIANELLEAEKDLKTIGDLRWQARNEMNKAQRSVNDEMRRIKTGEFWYRTGQVIDVTNSMRTMMASFDMSGALRQGGFFAFAKPELQGKAFANMFNTWFSDKNYGRVIMEIEANPLFTLAQRSGIDFAIAGKGEDSSLMGEELYRGESTIEKLPVLGKPISELIIKPSERTYTSFLDTQRMSVFEGLAKNLMDAGMTFEKNRPQFEQIGKFINVATGRGTVPNSAWGKIIMNLPLFAPRYTLSRFQLINMTLNPVAYYNMPAGTRAIVAKNAARFYGTTMGTLGFIALFGSALGLSVNFDDDDDDFLKITHGNTKYDIFAGALPVEKMLIKLIHSAYRTSLSTGDRLPKEFASDTWNALLRFGRGKLSPLGSLAVDALSGKDYTGNKTELTTNVGGVPLPGKAIYSRLIPLTIGDAVEAYKLDGGVGIAKSAPPLWFGVGVSTYKPRLERPETEAEKLAVKAAGWDFNGESKLNKEQRELKNELVARSRRGEDVSAEIEKGIADGYFTKRHKDEILSAAKKSLLVDKVESLRVEYVEQIYNLATPAEKEILLPILKKKLNNVKRELDPAVLKRLEEIGVTKETKGKNR